MSIDRFENAAATGFTGRLTHEKLNNEQAQKPTIFNKIASKISNLFKPMDHHAVANRGFEDRTLRQALANDLRKAYPQLPETFLDSVKEPRDKSLKKTELRQILQDAKTLALQSSLTLPGRDAPVTISPRLIAPSVIAANPDIVARLQDKVNNGAALVADILEGYPPEGAASLSDVSDVMWFLHLVAEESVGAFSSGAATVPDPGGRLRAFLDSCPEAYQRKSSHLSAFQREEHGAHRGIDFDFGSKTDLDTLLPNGQATVLYGQMAEGKLGMTEERLFIKLESHGCRLGTPSENRRDADGPAGRDVRALHDVKSSLGHFLSFMDGIEARATGEHAADSRKERVGREFLDGYKAVLDRAAALPGVGAQLTERLMENDPLSKSGGIRVMVANMDAVLNAAPGEFDFEGAIGLGGADEDATADGLELVGDFMTTIQAFRMQIMDRYPADTIQHRVGNEAVLTMEDLIPA